MLASSSVFSQLDGIVVEKYYQARSQDLTIANENKATGSPDLTTSFVTYRVYVDVAAGFRLSAVYGDANHPATFATTTSFYNYTGDLGGKEIWPTASTAATVGKALGLDSYFTMGQVADGQAGIIESEDGNTQLISTGTGSGLLLNNPGGTCFGAPLFGTGGIDGFTPGVVGTSIGEVSSAGLAGLTGALGMVGGGTITFSNGSFASQTGIVGPAATTSNKVLIGQFTTDGVFTFSFNVQILPVGGTTQYKYVYSNATGSEINNATLTLAPNSAPAVSITSVTQPTGTNTNILTGTVMTFNATASDNVSVSQVEFFVDGVSVGVDNSSPYSATYTAVAGVGRVVTAVATDNVCVTTTSAGSTFTVANNANPTVALTAPTSAIASSLTGNAVVTFSAIPTDNDGVSTISQVQFFVNGTSVGIDNTSPYSVQDTSIGRATNLQVTAVATDNLGATGTSTTTTLNVVANGLPSVNIAFASGTPSILSSYVDANAGSLFVITLSSLATDNDGTISNVKFYEGTTELGTATAAGNGVYTFPWLSTAGTHSIVAKATDNLGGVATSSPLNFVVNDILSLPYEVVSVTQTCENQYYFVTVKKSVSSSVDNVIGYDIVMNYDASKLQAPTAPADVEVLNNLVNPAYIDVAYSSAITGTGTNAVGALTISLSFKTTAPANAEFNGNGDLFKVKFTRLVGFAPFDQTQVSVPTMEESYVNTVVTKPVTPRNMFSTTQQNYVANLVYGFDSTPIVYNPAVPTANLVTNVYGSVNGTTISNPLAPVVPNTTGYFTHNFGNGTYVSFGRDIDNTVSVQGALSGFDAAVCKTLLINGYTLTTAPSIYQMLAMDVNRDGVISSGDLTQMKRRTVSFIGEYQQAWQYNLDGTPIVGAGPSKDFVFVDATRVAADPAYTRSATFPANDAVGYSKGKVPVVPFILPANQTGYSTTDATCPIVLPETYKVAMLGDADGSYGALAADGFIKSNEGDYILVDLGNAIVEGTKVSVPVSFVSEEIVNAFDIALQLNENKLSYVSNEDMQLGSESESFYNTDDKTFRYTAFNLNEYSSNARVSYFTFETVDGKIIEKDLTAELGLLNGKLTEVRFTKSSDLTNNNVDIYPNPSNGMFTVTSKVDGRVDIVDVTGKLVHPGVVVKANQMIEVNMPELSAGVYFVRVYSNNSMTTERIVIGE